VVRYNDHEEVLEAGDAFYMPPGHAPEAEAGTELIQISPAAELAEVEAALMQSMQESRPS
jgi:ribosomal protein L16 Arg81 hydroxylase